MIGVDDRVGFDLDHGGVIDEPGNLNQSQRRPDLTEVLAVNFADFGEADDLTTQVLASLSMGQNVYSAVYGVVSPFAQNSNQEDPLDSSYTPPFWYQGDGSLQI